MRLLIVHLIVIFLLSSTFTVKAELYEETLDRPEAYSGDHADEYIEDDKDQITEVIWPSVFSRRSYNVYQPHGNKEIASYKRPAIVLLHGGGGRTGASLVERWRDIADDHDVILLGPHASGRWNYGSDAKKFIPALLKEAIRKYNIDTNQIYLFGHSMGGRYALYLGALHSDKFAAIGVHAGKMDTTKLSKLLANNERKIPLVMINGTHDKGFPLGEVRASARTYAKHGHEVELYILNNHGHWYYDIAHEINNIVWDFFRYKYLND